MGENAGRLSSCPVFNGLCVSAANSSAGFSKGSKLGLGLGLPTPQDCFPLSKSQAPLAGRAHNSETDLIKVGVQGKASRSTA